MHTKRVEVKGYWSPDIDNVWAWRPDANEVFYLLEIYIGLVGEEASTIYSINVATPEGILANTTSDEIYKIIIQKEYSWKRVMSHINYLLSTIDTWNDYEMQAQLQCYFNSEYMACPSLPSQKLSNKRRFIAD